MLRTPMRLGLHIWVAVVITASLPSAAAQGSAQTTKPAPTTPAFATLSRESIAGEYSGNQMAVAAHLLLQPNGRFNYEFTYGALNETAEGTWDIHGSSVFLTTILPVNSPHFAVVGDQLNPYGILSIRLASGTITKDAPQRVYLIYGPNEPREIVDIATDGTVALPDNRLPSAFILMIPRYPTLLKPSP